MLPLLLVSAIALPWQLHATPGAHSIVAADRPFEAAGISWTAAGDVPLRIRVSPDGITWSNWIVPAIDGDLTDRSSGRFFSAITHFGAEQRFLETTFDCDVGAVTVTMFPPPSHRGRLAPESQSTHDIVSRVAWGCPDGEAAPLWPPEYSTVTHLVVHHTAGSNDLSDWAAEVRNIWYYHTYTNGWGDIGYNYLIDPDGVIYEGRAGGDGAIGAHFSCRNTNTAGVAMLGTYSTITPTPEALAALDRLLGDLCRRNGIDPMAIVFHPRSGLDLPTILGHRDGNVPGATCTITECPGDALYSLLPSIRSLLAEPPPPRRRAVTFP
ncbi:MAG TPA: N-acetylmuramoyl-L-alanine amidase [Thermoanaerobaculia bacterium]|jgi:hypothetical protein|nr:N-acetylmuramoyl-L-alanine amidase [Thermoanaerobaculia bacterium]